MAAIAVFGVHVSVFSVFDAGGGDGAGVLLVRELPSAEAALSAGINDASPDDMTRPPMLLLRTCLSCKASAQSVCSTPMWKTDKLRVDLRVRVF